MAQLEAISSCPITCCLRKETETHISTTSFQVVAEGAEFAVILSPPPSPRSVLPIAFMYTFQTSTKVSWGFCNILKV